MRLLISIIAFLPLMGLAQDKLYLRDGKVTEGEIISVSLHSIMFRGKDSAAVREVPKEKIIIAEKFGGTRYVFSNAAKAEANNTPTPKMPTQHFLGIQPFDIFIGRGTIAYEAYLDDGKWGIVIPLSITYNPFGDAFKIIADSTYNHHAATVGAIGGVDLNFYIGKSKDAQFFVGPRLRYGTDLALGEVRAFTAQTQFGWFIRSQNLRMVQHLAFGFGLVQVYSVQGMHNQNSRSFWGWYSLTYRISLRL